MRAAFSLHPDNPHYFLFRDKPAILITSGEHYGVVMNKDFNYIAYLEELNHWGLNHTRIFSGVYHEVPGSFNIECNTLAPSFDRFVCPWPRSSVPGAVDGGMKFDLASWNTEYFKRLHDFCIKASELGIVIEVNLFCPFYSEILWDICPLNSRNNINDIGSIDSNEVYTLKHRDILQYQKALVEKIVHELNGYDNIYYEICNEPWVNGVAEDWQYHMAEVITDMERTLPFKHLISLNVSNGYQLIENPQPSISIYNFHYASPPYAVPMNYHLNKAIGFNETGFNGQNDSTYRSQAWEFILAGGALYNNLDYSFAVGWENGRYLYNKEQPGGGSRALRKQLGILKKFIESFDYIKMAPDQGIIKRLATLNGTGYVLSQPGKAYALYIKGFGEVILTLDIPEGQYKAEWISPVTGEIVKEEDITHHEKTLKIGINGFKEDIALRMIKAD